MNISLQQLAQALGGEIVNGQVLAPGPRHNSKDRSLSVRLSSTAPDGFVTHSFAGDDEIECRDHVRVRTGMPAFNPVRKDNRGAGGKATHAAKDYKRSPEMEALLAANAAAIAQRQGEQTSRGRVTHVYDYTDRDGTLVFQVLRHESKSFTQRRPDPDRPGDWIYKLDGIERVPYRLPDVLQFPNATLFVTEGEKDADNCAALGLCATTAAGSKWTDSCVRALTGRERPFANGDDRFGARDIVILQDNDAPGARKALAAAQALHGYAKTIRIVLLPGLPADGGDLTDWLEDTSAVPRHDRDLLIELCLQFPPWAPGSAGETVGDTADDGVAEANRHSKNLLSYPEMVQLPKPVWRVENVLPDGDTAVLFGESNSFKSFLAVDLACSVACGIEWHGHRVMPGRVIYVASESAYGIGSKRIPAWMAHREIPPEQRRDIFLRVSPPLLDDQPSLATFENDIASVQPVALIIYDVLAGTMKGSEKDTDVLAAWVRVVNDISARLKCTQLFVTHSPYSEPGRIRGGTHLWGSFATRLKAEGDRGKRTTILSVERHKDHDSNGLRWGFKMEIANIDELAGETSLVATMDAAVGAKGVKLTGAAKDALHAFKYALAEGACSKVPDNEHIPPSADLLPDNLWRLYFDKLTPAEGTADTKRKQFGRGVKRLFEMKLVAKWGEQWWLTDAGKAIL
ncbi:AAA family ATPase [Bradyrhizobium sp. WSM2254]|uniref:AAA family ATPase n=1 Tax=Bradyrhizobium sp. WSM2254 TaxID=1188263 RepID=UPI0004082696|nr:AAA family ATPase [Bradyrhizobium sp. WSM2254]